MDAVIWNIILVVAVFCFSGAQAGGCSGFKMLRKGELSCTEKKIIVDEHNRLRSAIAMGTVSGQPAASNMMEMVWDDELAYLAQRWANLCNEYHDSDRTVGRFTIGQNLALSWTTRNPSSSSDAAPNFVHQINNWFNEVQRYNPNSINSGTGHYTQVIWSNTYAVGCGYSYYWDPRRGYTKNYVCNYGPSGNVLGYQPYRTGRPSCANYGMNWSRLYSGLCSKGFYHPLGAHCTTYN
ncbi:venom allergen 5-like [Diprion similis]|uniref:venom allergen 5-like n=1 Tax=Diprion similis TaxID=362088 RepID=UPI001EF98F44|nr:venom allergen 5-like [Diprion similis]